MGAKFNRGWRLGVGAFSCAIIVVCAAGGGVARSALHTYPIVRNDDPKLDSRLTLVADAQRSAGPVAAIAAGARAGLASQSGRVRVVVVSKPGAVERAKRAVSAVGGALEASAGDLSDALVPPAALRTLADSPSIERVRPPYVHEADAVDEGVHLSDADTWHSAGYDGAGVKIAIIDLGFAGYTSLLGSALPASVTTVDDCNGQLTTATDHGAAVAEIVHQMAPGAQLYLICIADEVQLAQAEQYVLAHNIKIVNHSVSWFDTSRGDGTGAAGTPDAIVADARAHGVLWVNAAGNYQQDHWTGYFTPDSSNPVFNDFRTNEPAEQFQVAAGGNSCVLLKWDGWPVTSEDYDLLVTRVSDGTTVATSGNVQADAPSPPVEEACFTNSTGATATYAASIVRYSAAGFPLLDLYVIGDVGPITRPLAQSVTEPASSAAVLAVGAVCWQTGDVEPYSSEGGTIDGRLKPDLVADDSVSTATYGAATAGAAGCGASGFSGTSAAAPQVAGAAGVLLGRSPSWTPAELTAALETRAQDNQQTDQLRKPDNGVTGHGPLALGLTNPIGTIAFNVGGGSAYVTDGMGVSYVTGNSGLIAYSNPVWSPDGSKLLVHQSPPISPPAFLTVTADGTPTGDVFSGALSFYDGAPSWAPDNRTIVVYRSTASGLVKLDVTGAVTQLGPADLWSSTAWAPDNSKIAYVRTTSGQADVWTMNPDGTGQAKLTSVGGVSVGLNGMGGALAWSPDASKLLFVRGSNPSTIWVVNANGSNAHALTTTGSASAPSWSPDGTMILFVQSGDALELMNADGSGIRPLNPHQPITSSGEIERTSWTSATPSFGAFPQDTRSISGLPEVGHSVEAAVTPWVGTPGTTFGYQWERCQPSDTCGDVPGATESMYSPSAADIGYVLRVRTVANGVPGPESDPTTQVIPARPVDSTPPTLSGGATVGSTLTIASPGNWSGSPVFSYGWEWCDRNGGYCFPIPGAYASSYTVTADEVGGTIRGAVVAQNGGRSVGSLTLPSAVITGSNGGGGGGGGGGSALPPNLRLQWTSVSNSSPPTGSEVDFVITVDNHGGGSAQNTHLQFTLPAEMKLVGPPYYERGSGCVVGVAVVCNLDYLPNGSSTVVKFGVIVSGSDTLYMTATATADREADPSDNSAMVTVHVIGASGAPPPPPPVVHKGKTINGTAGPNHLTGTAYADVLSGLGGNDLLYGLGGNDTLNGGTGKDRLYGGAGNDLLNPGAGVDVVYGGPGNDVVHARDKTVDVIDCGTGRDIVYADKHDKVAKNCEIVHRA